MPEYLSPGVYVEEFEIGAKPIEGVSTSTAGFLGEAARGPTTPTLVTSWLEYQRRFGSYFGANKYLPFSVQGFFDNGGQRCFIGRIVKIEKTPATPAIAKLTAGGNPALTVEAFGEGSWGNRVSVKVSNGTDKGFKLQIFYEKDEPEEEFDNISVIDTEPEYYEKKVNELSNFIRLSKKTGDSGNQPEPGYSGTSKGAGTSNTILFQTDTASSSDNAYNGMMIEITDGTGKGQARLITAYIGATTKTATVKPNWDTVPDATSRYSLYWILRRGADSSLKGTAQTQDNPGTRNIKLASNTPGDVDFSNAKIEITEGTGSGQLRTISGYTASTYVATISEDWTIKPDNTSRYFITLQPQQLVIGDYIGPGLDEPGKRKGLASFAEVDDISIVYVPNAQAVGGLVDGIITHCEKLKDRFAIIDAPQNSANVGSLNPRSDNNSTYAAYYYPWIYITHPQSGALYQVPPGGHIAGIYARSDTERGVHKAPANETVRGARKVEFPITTPEQAILNPRGVNVIRMFPGRGILVWGARTLSTNTLWKYVNVRRLFIFVEESLYKGTQWVVFEPNNEKLWARVRATINQFLTGVWRDGALMGTKAEEAFFVKCDRSTMTQDDIDNGKLIIIIGIAPVKPAEFVIIRITQWAGGSAPKE